MKLFTAHDNGPKENIQKMEIGQVFRFSNKNTTFESDLINGELFMIIENGNGLNNSNLTSSTKFVRLSGKFEYVSRTGPLFGFNLEDDLSFFHTAKTSVTLEQLQPGDGVTFDNDEEEYLVVTDPVDTTKMISLMNVITCELIKLSKESECYKHEVGMEIR